MEDLEIRIGRVIDYIYDNLDDELSLDQLAEVACVSRFHWQRIYSTVMKESCVATVRRVRLHRAAVDLLKSQKSTSEIAIAAGYADVASFTRAFSNAYQLSPASFRKEGRMPFRPEMTILKKGDLKMYDVEIKEFEGGPFGFMPHKGDYMKIGQVFETLYGVIGSRGLLNEVQASIGVYYDDPGSVALDELRSAAGVVLGENVEILPPLEAGKIAGGRHAVLRHVGDYSGLDKAYKWLYGDWMPASEYEPADRPVFEIYQNSPADTAPADLITDIYLPIKD